MPSTNAHQLQNPSGSAGPQNARLTVGYSPAFFRASVVGAGLLIFGARLWLIATYGSSLPFGDEWINVVPRLFIPYVEGDLSLGHLLEPHNEHRIVFSRLLYLLLFEVNGQFDPVVGMVANAGLSAITAMALIVILARISTVLPAQSVAFFVALLWSLPIGTVNALWSLQSQFYFLIFFALPALWGLLLHETFTLRWWTGLLCAVCACFTMAAGPGVALVVLLLKCYLVAVDRRSWRNHLPTIAFCAVLVALALVLQQSISIPNPYRATGLRAFLLAFASNLAWPYTERPAKGLLLLLPFVVFLAGLLISRRVPRKDELIVLGLGAWSIFNAAVIAYARGKHGETLPCIRYYDLFLFTPLCSAFSIFFIHVSMRKLRRWSTVGLLAIVGTWTALFALGLHNLISQHNLVWLTNFRSMQAGWEGDCRRYMKTGDIESLSSEPGAYGMHADPDVLASYLDHGLLRNRLPAAIASPDMLRPESRRRSDFVQDGFYRSVPAREGEYVLGSYGPKGDEDTGVFLSKPFFVRQSYLEIPVSGYLGSNGDLAFFVFEAELDACDFHSYAFDLPRACPDAVKIVPSAVPCDIVLESVEVETANGLVPLPSGQPGPLKPCGRMSFVVNTSHGAAYHCGGPESALIVDNLRALKREHGRLVRLVIRMWTPEASEIEIGWIYAGESMETRSVAVKSIPASRQEARLSSQSMQHAGVPDKGIAVIPHEPPGEKWVSCYVRRPGNPIRCLAIDRSESFAGWFAFAMPKGVGQLSYISMKLCRLSVLMIVSGAILLLATPTIRQSFAVASATTTVPGAI